MPQFERRRPVSDVYREMVWRIPLGVAVVEVTDPLDPGAARVLAANPAALRMKDFSPRDVIGRPIREVLPQVLDRIKSDKLAQMMRDGVPRDLGYVPGVRHPERTYAVKVFPLPENSVGVVFEDVTKERALVAAEDRFWKALHGAPFAMAIIRTRDAQLREANARFLDLFGFGVREEIVGRSAREHVWSDPGGFARSLDALRREGELREEPLEARRRDGTRFRALVALEMVTFEEEDCVLALFWRS